MEPATLRRAAENSSTDDPASAAAPAWSPATVPQLLRLRASASPASPAQWSLDARTGRWRCVTWREFEQRVATVSAVLRRRGLTPGQRVGIIAPSSARWD
ncbi:MAG TPA: AMP-binding protein, partial [Casimicrobiaceae bacterium]